MNMTAYLIWILLIFVVSIIVIITSKSRIVKSVADKFYEEREFRVKKELKMTGLFGIEFPNIKLYELDRNENGELDENSPLYIYVESKLAKEIRINEKDPNFDISDAFAHMLDKKSKSYFSYIHLMRILTNVNFEAFVIKGMKYDFSRFNKDVLSEIENHVDDVIVEVGTNMIKRILSK